jgi:hypothetical protein
VRRSFRVAGWGVAITGALVGAGLEVGARLAESIGERRDAFAFANSRPPSLAAPPVRLAFLGDVQEGIGDVARPLVEALADEKPAVLVIHGDLAAHGEAPYYGVVAGAFAAAGLATPTLVAPGNHDVEPDGVRDRGPGRRLFEERVGPRTWSFRAGALLVVGVDDGAETDVEPAVLARLDEVLAASPTGPWLLVCHRPPRQVDRPDAPVTSGCEGLVQRVEARPPVAVVSGHLHHDADVVVRGVRYYVNAHGGDVAAKASAPSDFRIVIADVAADGAVTFRPVSRERRWWMRVEVERLCVAAWGARRRHPWSVALLPVGIALAVGLVVARRRGRRVATPASAA